MIEFRPYAGANTSVTYFEQIFLLAQAAEFNADLAVSGSDFLIWQRGRPSSTNAASHAKGDATGDYIIDANDLSVWSEQYAGGAPHASAAVPEPSTATASLAGAGVCWGYLFVRGRGN